MVERNASGMFIFYNKVLVENSVNANVKSQLSTLMFDLKGNSTNTIILTDTKDREHKTRKLQDKVTNSTVYCAHR